MIRIYIESLIAILIITTICIDRSSCNRIRSGPDCRFKDKEPLPPTWPPTRSSFGLSLNRPNRPPNPTGPDVILPDKKKGRGSSCNRIRSGPDCRFKDKEPLPPTWPPTRSSFGLSLNRPNRPPNPTGQDVMLPDKNQGRGRRPNDIILPDKKKGRAFGLSLNRPNRPPNPTGQDVILPDKNQGRGRRPNDVILPDKKKGRAFGLSLNRPYPPPNDVILPDKNQGRGQRPNDVILPDQKKGRGRKKSFTDYLSYLFITGQFDKFREAIRNAVPWNRPRPKNKKRRPDRFRPQ